MKILKKLFLLIAVGLAPIVLAGCYGMQASYLNEEPLDNPPALDAEPIAGLQTVAIASQER